MIMSIVSRIQHIYLVKILICATWRQKVEVKELVYNSWLELQIGTTIDFHLYYLKPLISLFAIAWFMYLTLMVGNFGENQYLSGKKKKVKTTPKACTSYPSVGEQQCEQMASQWHKSYCRRARNLLTMDLSPARKDPFPRAYIPPSFPYSHPLFSHPVSSLTCWVTNQVFYGLCSK